MKFKETRVGNNRHRLVRCKTCGKVFDAYNGKADCGGIFYHCIEPFCEGKLLGERNLESISKEEAFAWLSEKYEGDYERMVEVRSTFDLLTEEDRAYIEAQKAERKERYAKKKERDKKPSFA